MKIAYANIVPKIFFIWYEIIFRFSEFFSCNGRYHLYNAMKRKGKKMTTTEMKIAPGMYISACRKAGIYGGKDCVQTTYNGQVSKVAYTKDDTMVVIRILNEDGTLSSTHKTVYLSSLSGWLVSDYAW